MHDDIKSERRDGAHVLVRDGVPNCFVVVDLNAPGVDQLAAEELCKHLTVAFRGTVSVLSPEAAQDIAGVRLVVGAWDTGDFLDEEYVIQSDKNTIHFAGHNTGKLLGSSREIVGKSSQGTLYAVYHFLDHYLGVRWLWPGETGTYVPRYTDLSLSALQVRTRPELERRCLRAVNTVDGQNPYLANLDERRQSGDDAQAETQDAFWEQICRDEVLWGYRHHMGSRTDLRFSHSYPHWWEAYHEEHPELFAHPPEGFEQPYPNARWVKLCVSNPGVADMIMKEWREAGRPLSWCVGPNDGRGWCTCDACRALDGIEQDPQDIWGSKGVTLTGRYTHLWNQLLPRLRAECPDARLSCYAYSTYRDTLPDTQLHEGMVLAVVHMYSEQAREQWSHWSKAGARLFLRPNWFHMGACYPHIPLHRAGDYFRFARAHAMVGFMFDSLMGYWATQGPFYYLIARLGARADLSVDDVIEEYCSAFGHAAPFIKKFLSYWEEQTEALAVPVPAGGAASQNVDGLHERACRELHIGIHPLHASWRVLSIVASDEILAPARSLLDQAKQEDDCAEVLARIDFLVDGLEHLAQLRDFIALCYADELPEGMRDADVESRFADLVRFQDGLTPRHVVCGPLLRQTLESRKVRTSRKDVGKVTLDGI